MQKINVNIDKAKIMEAEKSAKGFFGEFRKFIRRGNVMDLAVGVVLGSAFSAIVTSLVNDIIMPLIGMLIGGINFTDLSVTVGSAVLHYGNFIQNVINFIIIAWCIFIVIKSMNKFLSKISKEEKEKPPVKSDEVKLLEEIRDELKSKK